jgi:hypothetical protein
MWSAICAGLGLTACFPLGIILGPVALVLARISRRRIKASAGALGGIGLAMFGLLAGGAVTLIWLAVVGVYVVRITMGVQRAGG